MTTTQEKRISGLEVRSIDYVPLDERHGKLWHLGPLWFMSNAQIATLAVGLISITTGGTLWWSLIAIVAGTLVGTLFIGEHLLSPVDDVVADERDQHGRGGDHDDPHLGRAVRGAVQRITGCARPSTGRTAPG